MDLMQTLEALSSVAGPAGSEDLACALAVDLLTPYMDRVYTDTLGNVIGERACGKPGARRVLIDAHLDEVGFVVTGHKSSFPTISPLGRVDARLLPGTRLRVLTDPPIIGVVPCMPPHVLSSSAMNQAMKIEDMVLDLGLSSDAASAIRLGTPVVFDSEPIPMGDNLFSGKALDNRACLAALLLALSRLPKALDVDLVVMASVQEELGLRGAEAGLFSLKPDIYLALDVTFGHVPGTSSAQTCQFGGGAAIGVGPVLSRSLTDLLVDLAASHKIPYQMEVLSGKSSTTADLGQITHGGVPTALISLPLRYMHSASELVNLADIEAVSNLVAAFLLHLEGGGIHA